ncbi:retrotransposon protein, putative, ty1-copia subclass [Tanacetum coccineum]
MTLATTAKRAKHNLDSTYLWHCRLAQISKKCIEKLQRGGLLKSTDDEYLTNAYLVYLLTPPYTPQHNSVYERSNCTLLDMVRSMINLTTLALSFWNYALESATRILNMDPTKKVDKTPDKLWYAEFLKKNLISQEASGRAVELEEIQDEDTSPSKNTSEHLVEAKSFEPP